jgi:hypothetical protein
MRATSTIERQLALVRPALFFRRAIYKAAQECQWIANSARFSLGNDTQKDWQRYAKRNEEK